MTMFTREREWATARLGIAATRKIGSTPSSRNRAKRLVRELFRRHKPGGCASDVVVVPRREMLDASYDRLEAEFRSLLTRYSSHRAAHRLAASRSRSFARISSCCRRFLPAVAATSPGCADYMSRSHRASRPGPRRLAGHEAPVPLSSLWRSRLRPRPEPVQSYFEFKPSANGTPRPHRNHSLVSRPVSVSAVRDASARRATGKRDTGGASRTCSAQRCHGSHRRDGRCQRSGTQASPVAPAAPAARSRSDAARDVTEASAREIIVDTRPWSRRSSRNKGARLDALDPEGIPQRRRPAARPGARAAPVENAIKPFTSDASTIRRSRAR